MPQPPDSTYTPAWRRLLLDEEDVVFSDPEAAALFDALRKLVCDEVELIEMEANHDKGFAITLAAKIDV